MQLRTLTNLDTPQLFFRASLSDLGGTTYVPAAPGAVLLPALVFAFKSCLPLSAARSPVSALGPVCTSSVG